MRHQAADCPPSHHTPDVNVIGMKINFMIHSGDSNLQMGEVAQPFQQQYSHRPPRYAFRSQGAKVRML